MKVVILAGGLGTRLSEYTDLIPKPMIEIGGRPIIWHIMNRYALYGHKDFYIALGYKSKVVKEYFYNYKALHSNFFVNLETGKVLPLNNSRVDWNVSLIDTGELTMTGGRVKRMREFVKDETFLLTYGDGVADIDIDKLIKFHKNHGKLVTVTAVRPPARFGELEISNSKVINFKEKPQLMEGWISGGYFVIEPEFLDYISSDNTMLEREPLEWAARNGQLMAYQHNGFWQCMDTKRDHDHLDELAKSKNTPWMIL